MPMDMKKKMMMKDSKFMKLKKAMKDGVDTRSDGFKEEKEILIGKMGKR